MLHYGGDLIEDVLILLGIAGFVLSAYLIKSQLIPAIAGVGFIVLAVALNRRRARKRRGK